MRPPASYARMGLALAALLLMAACDDTDDAPPSGSTDTGEFDAGTGDVAPDDDATAGEDATDTDDAADDVAPADAPDAAPEGPTWYGSVATTLEKHCGSCHLPSGQGVGDFTDYTVARAFAASMIGAVESGRMPPPASDPECRDYVNADRWNVPDTFGEELQAWIDAGYPEGDEADYVPVPPIPMELESPDIELRMPHAYTPTFEDPANPGNEYRCFVLDHGQDETFYIRAMAPIIDQTEVVHHIVLFKVREADIPERNDPVTGFDCIDMTFFGGAGAVSGDSGMISAWAPGSQEVRFADGAGIRMDPDHRLIMQMHYYNARPDEALADQSGYALEVTDEARTQVLMVPYGPTGFRIPAGDENYHRSTEFTTPVALRVHGVMPHMHYLGQSYRMWFTPDGEETECIVQSERYDFNNQLTYMFHEPLVVPRGSAVGFECTWNNSPSNPYLVHNPPIEIRYGERTDEEMCFGFALVSVGAR